MASQDKTSRLWIEYLKQMAFIRLFIRAERFGNFELHLHAISEMIPLFHASGHLSYAKSARLYLDQMRSLRNVMSPAEYTNYTSKGFFKIRRSEKHWAGNFSGQVIEQDEMRLSKTSGGLAHGRGITESMLDK